MQLFLACLTAFCLLFSLSACAPRAERDPFAYANAPFSLSVEGTYLPAGDAEGTPRPVAATVTAGSPLNGDPTFRELTVTFTAPPAMRGVTVIATPSPASDGEHPSGGVRRAVVFTYHSDYGEVEVTAKGGELDGFLRFAEALLPVSDIAEVSPVAEDGTYTVIRRSDGGEREAVFIFTQEGIYPQRVKVTDTLGSLDLTVTPNT